MKICLFDGCNRPVFSNLFCKYHQSQRTDSKAMEAKNRPIEPRSAVRPYKRTTSDKSELKTTKSELLTSFGFNNQKEMFDFVWGSRPHVCQLSGMDLESVPQWQHHWIYGHILPKGKYVYYKLNPDNILLLHPDVHVMVDNFTEDMREKHKGIYFDKWFSLVAEQKEKYRLFLLENML